MTRASRIEAAARALRDRLLDAVRCGPLDVTLEEDSSLVRALAAALAEPADPLDEAVQRWRAVPAAYRWDFVNWLKRFKYGAAHPSQMTKAANDAAVAVLSVMNALDAAASDAGTKGGGSNGEG